MTKALVHRLAVPDDFDALMALQYRATIGLSGDHYDLDAMRVALEEVPILTRDLIEDGHYHVLTEPGGRILAGGGWSDRAVEYGRSSGGTTGALPPGQALIRAVYVDPIAARKGLGTRIMKLVETDAIANGIRHFTLTATLPGQLLYEYLGYHALHPIEKRLSTGHTVRLVAMDKTLSHNPKALPKHSCAGQARVGGELASVRINNQ